MNLSHSLFFPTFYVFFFIFFCSFKEFAFSLSFSLFFVILITKCLGVLFGFTLALFELLGPVLPFPSSGHLGPMFPSVLPLPFSACNFYASEDISLAVVNNIPYILYVFVLILFFLT